MSFLLIDIKIYSVERDNIKIVNDRLQYSFVIKIFARFFIICITVCTNLIWRSSTHIVIKCNMYSKMYLI